MTKKLSAFELKLIAIVGMLINHIGHAFEYEWNPPLWQFFYLFIGLLTFPIMAYLLVEGFFHTRNRWKYVGRFAIFWLISILPFHYLFEPWTSWINPINNIMFTLMMGLILLMLCEKFTQYSIQMILAILFIFLTLKSDWNVFGIPIIMAFYQNHGQPRGRRSFLMAVMLFMLVLTFPNSLDFWSPEMMNWLSRLGLLLVVPILDNYNGQRGYSPKWIKWGFYLFYPLHLSILLLLRYAIFGY